MPYITNLTKMSDLVTKTLEKQKLNFSCSALFHMKTRVNLKHFVSYCICELFFDSNSPQTPSNLIYLTNLVTLRPFIPF